MGVKTISVTDTAYNLLLSMKSEDEDISEAILVKVFSLEKKL